MSLATFNSWLIEDARRNWHRMWSVRIALFWAAVQGLYAVWDAFSGKVPTGMFVGVGIFMSLAICVARLTKQTGVDD